MFAQVQSLVLLTQRLLDLIRCWRVDIAAMYVKEDTPVFSTVGVVSVSTVGVVSVSTVGVVSGSAVGVVSVSTVGVVSVSTVGVVSDLSQSSMEEYDEHSGLRVTTARVTTSSVAQYFIALVTVGINTEKAKILGWHTYRGVLGWHRYWRGIDIVA